MKVLRNKIIIFFGFLGLALGFLFCFNALSVSAEVVENTTEPETTEVTTDNNTGSTEQADAKTDAEVVDFFIDRIKSLKWEDAQAIIGWVITYLVLNFGVILGFAVTFIIKKTKEVQATDVYQKALAKLSAEQQAKVENLINNFTTELADFKKDIDERNTEYQNRLEEAKNEETKEISQALGNILNSINKE